MDYLDYFVENQLNIYMFIYFWIFFSVPLIYTVIFTPISQCSGYCSIILSLKSGSANSPMSFLFANCLAILRSLCFHINFRTSLPNFIENPARILIGIALDVLINFRRYAILILSAPIHEHGISLHLFRSSLILLSDMF